MRCNGKGIGCYTHFFPNSISRIQFLVKTQTTQTKSSVRIVAAMNNSGTKDIGAELGVYALPLAPVPLPPAVWMFGAGLLGLMGFRRRQLSV
jgi:hypothetical protein